MATKAKTNSITFNLDTKQIDNFTDKINDLVKIDDKVLLQLSNTEPSVLYSIVGDNIKNIHSFKSHIFSPSEWFTKYSGENIEGTARLVIRDGKKVSKILDLFSKNSTETKCKIVLNDELYGEKMILSNDDDKYELVGGDPTLFRLKLDVNTIRKSTDPKSANYIFKLTKERFETAKKYGVLDKDNDIMHFVVKDETLYVSATNWELKLASLPKIEEQVISFPKKYFSSIYFGDTTELNVYVFEPYFFVNGETTNMMVSTELR